MHSNLDRWIIIVEQNVRLQGSMHPAKFLSSGRGGAGDYVYASKDAHHHGYKFAEYPTTTLLGNSYWQNTKPSGKVSIETHQPFRKKQLPSMEGEGRFFVLYWCNFGVWKTCPATYELENLVKNVFET